MTHTSIKKKLKLRQIYIYACIPRSNLNLSKSEKLLCYFNWNLLTFDDYSFFSNL